MLYTHTRELCECVCIEVREEFIGSNFLLPLVGSRIKFRLSLMPGIFTHHGTLLAPKHILD